MYIRTLYVLFILTLSMQVIYCTYCATVYAIVANTVHVYHSIVTSQGGQRNRPGAVVGMLEHPLDQGKVI